MRFHEFGDKQNPTMILIHGVLTPWQIWDDQIAHFSKKYHVIVPALDAHEEERSTNYVSIEKEAEQIEQYCLETIGDKVEVLCGLSMGGAIAHVIWKNQRLKIASLVLDGAPLATYSRVLTKAMTGSYSSIIQKSKKRDAKTLANFKKNFLPEKYFESYLRIADNMDDSSVGNMVRSIATSLLDAHIPGDTRVLYIHGTAVNEMLSKKSAKLMKKAYPNARIVCCKGCVHCEHAIYAPQKWTEIVENFLG